ncbi:bifunctional 3-oxoadipate enol-lactonase/4-carboxymuconolactone decarboxylase PcaDC [Larsenimonas rhizosphaerae]|uniref:bifunctional 3-oxoadipate enol-lactonase/4-carboxymuconolactone decarboxylase PcaDC n=1 Tax=Larsenimonas rhizosphaerae TaxID=2944682 RepID=UPI0020345469|nr:alpha/beta fold hydrolase [Larsenimonas rhizosphaerae]MCM2131526.1 alpha/beta fold hydrolase [Larsenimonas rhizosphaerae]
MSFFGYQGRTVAYRDSGGTTLPTLVLGHPLGMSQAVWDEVIPRLSRRFRLITWDLPGHGGSSPVTGEITPSELAADVRALLNHLDVPKYHYAGTSIGGVIGQALLCDAPERLDRVALTNTGAVIGTPANWQTRARRVREEGLHAMAPEITARWFSDSFRRNQTATLAGWQVQLARTDAESYAQLSLMLGDTDFSKALSGHETPVALLAGDNDLSTPPATLKGLSEALGGAPLETFEGIAHVPSVECPDRFVDWLTAWLLPSGADIGSGWVDYDTGLATRRQVLGEAHVERASHNATSLDQPFQQMITRLAWGELWGNTDLSHRDRSLITLAVLAALGRDGELALHLDTAHRIGVTEAELRQALTHVAVYAGVPAANHAFKMAKEHGWGEQI